MKRSKKERFIVLKKKTMCKLVKKPWKPFRIGLSNFTTDEDIESLLKPFFFFFFAEKDQNFELFPKNGKNGNRTKYSNDQNKVSVSREKFARYLHAKEENAITLWHDMQKTRETSERYHMRVKRISVQILKTLL